MKKILLFLFILTCFSINAQKRIIGANNVVTILAGEAFENWTLVRIEGGRAYKADPSDINKAAVAMSIDTSFAENDTIQVAYGGTLQGFDIAKGKSYFLAIDGTFDTIQPTSGFYQSIGKWVEDSTLQLNIQNPIQIFETEKFLVLADGFSTSSATPSDVGLEFDGEESSTYVIRFYGLCQFGVSSSGIGLFVKYGELEDGSWGEAVVFGRVTNNLEPKTTTSSQQVLNNQVAGTTGSNGTGTEGGLSDGTNNAVEGWWIVNTTTAGTIRLRCRSEVDSESIYIFPGAILSYKKLE